MEVVREEPSPDASSDTTAAPPQTAELTDEQLFLESATPEHTVEKVKKITKRTRIEVKQICNVFVNILPVDSADATSVFLIKVAAGPIVVQAASSDAHEKIHHVNVEIGCSSGDLLSNLEGIICHVFMPLLDPQLSHDGVNNSAIDMEEAKAAGVLSATSTSSNGVALHQALKVIDAVRNEFKSNLVKFSSQITNAIQQIQGDIHLNIPDVVISKPESHLDDYELINILEQALEEWPKSVANVVDQEMRKTRKRKGPLAEIEFWRERNATLSTIYEQIDMASVQKMIKLLELVEASMLLTFKCHFSELSKLYIEAKDNVKFLTTLERHFKNIANGSFIAVADTLPSMTNAIRMVWIISRHYNTDERMVPLMERIAFEIADKVAAEINIHTILRKSPENALHCIKKAEMVLELWHSTYMKVRERIEASGTDHRWEFDRKRLFEQTNYTAKICENLQEVATVLDQFNKFLGSELKSVTGDSQGIDEVIARVESLIAPFESVPFKIFDRGYKTSWESVMVQFRDKSHESINKQMMEKYKDILMQYTKELEKLDEQFQKCKHNPPVFRNHPPVAGAISWARALYLRAKKPILRFRAMNDLLKSPLGEEVKEKYWYSLEQWTRTSASSIKTGKIRCQHCLKQSILGPKLIEAGKSETGAMAYKLPPPPYFSNFSPELTLIIKEAKFLDRLRFEIPEEALNVTLQEDKYHQCAAGWIFATLKDLDQQACSTLNLNFSSRTSSLDVQTNLQANVDKRSGKIYGPPAGKKLTIFIDDLNIPKVDLYGTQQPIALLHFVMSRGSIYDRGKELDLRILKDLLFIGAMDPPGGGRNQVDPRFVAQFNVYNLTPPTEEVLKHIYGAIIKETFAPEAGFAMVDPIIFGDYADCIGRITGQSTEDPRLYQDMDSYKPIRSIFDEALETGKQSLSRLAAFTAGCDLFEISLTRGYGENEFHENLKDLYRKLGKNKVVFLFTDAHAVEEGFLEFINNMLTTGMVPALFEQGEKDGLSSMVGDEVKAAGLNLHIILAMSPSGSTLRTRCRNFPDLVSATVIDWLFPWPEDALHNVAQYFLAEETIREDFRAQVTNHLVHAHLRVVTVAHQFAEEIRRYYYVTPKTYLDLISNYRLQLKENNQKASAGISRLKGGLTKLNEASQAVDRMQAELSEKKVTVDEKTLACEALIKTIEEKSTVATKQQEVASMTQIECEKAPVLIAKEKEEADIALLEALPAIEAAAAALQDLSKADLTEIKSFASPPPLVMSVCMCVLILKPAGQELDLDWEGAKVMLSNPNLLTLLKEYEKDKISSKMITKIKTFFKNPDLNVENMKSISKTGAGLLIWLVAIVKYYDVAKSVEPLKQKVKTMEKEQAVKEQELADLTETLQRLKTELDTLSKQFQKQTRNCKAVNWIEKKEEKNNLTVKTLSDSDFMKHLELAIRFGNPFLFESVDEELDPILDPVLEKSMFMEGSQRFIKLGDKNVEWDPNFRLYFTSKLANPRYSPEVMGKTMIVNYSVTQGGLANQLLDIVVAHEWPDLEEQYRDLVTEMPENTQMIVELEDTLLRELSNSTGDIPDNEELIATLDETKNKAAEIGTKLELSSFTKDEITKARTVYTTVAVRGSIMYFAMSALSTIMEMHEVSLTSFLNVFHNSLDNVSYGFNEPDFNISRKLLSLYFYKAYVDGDEQLPWGSLKYLIGDAMHSGRVSDDYDRRILTTYLSEYMGDFLFDDCQTFYSSQSGFDYGLPAGNSDLEVYTQMVETLPLTNSPAVFGLHPNAEIRYYTNMSKSVWRDLISLQPRSAQSGAGVSREKYIGDVASDIQSKVPRASGCGELDRWNMLAARMTSSLSDLQKALIGEIGMSDELDAVGNALYDGFLPNMWRSLSPKTEEPLGSWMEHFMLRFVQYMNWVEHGDPKVMWLSGLGIPESYLTAMVQATCRAKNWSLDQVDFVHESDKLHGCQRVLGPREKLLGATHPKKLIEELPILQVIPIEANRLKLQNTFRTPVYVTQSRYNAMGVGLIFEANLFSHEHANHWVLQGSNEISNSQMDVLALNEQLRSEFSPVVRQLQLQQMTISSAAAAKQQQLAILTPPPVSNASASTTTPAPSPSGSEQQQAVRIDHYKHHCHTILNRLNTYQYGTVNAFKLDIEQLLKVARSHEQQQELQERLNKLQVGKSSQPGDLQFDASAGIPDLQEILVDGKTKKWVVNVNIQEHPVPVGTYLTRENALKAYELWRFDLSTSQSGVTRVYKLAEHLAQVQRASDADVIHAAMRQCHPELGWLQRRQDLVSLSAHPVVHSTLGEREALGPSSTSSTPVATNTPTRPGKRSAANGTGKSASRALALCSSPTPSSQTSSQSPQLTPAPGSASSSKWKKRKKPAHRLAHLRLRRLIQKRLCPHLKGKEVCVLRRIEMAQEDKTAWTPTGRLENGQVFSYKQDKLVSFADYVQQEMGPASACPHMFLVATHESIDDHLAVCDTFSEQERIQLGQDFFSSCQNYMNAPEHSKASGSGSAGRRRS
ncbi:Dynein heavy chain, partial [Globisporangium splendens]